MASSVGLIERIGKQQEGKKEGRKKEEEQSASYVL